MAKWKRNTFVLMLLMNIMNIIKVNSEKIGDDLQFSITWAGYMTDADVSNINNELETIEMKTVNQEVYHCVLPRLPTGDENSNKEVTGIHPLALLTPLLKEGSKCSYRLEPYWSYEVCHGKHVRQFHEEKNMAQEVKVQEFFLGSLNKEEKDDLVAEIQKPIGKVKMMKFDGRDTPFYDVAMKNGTKCDLSGHPRQVKTVYICHAASNNEVMSVKEVTSCEYEVIVLTPLLCSNPAFRLQESPVYDIKCHSVEGAPIQPKGLSEHERETFLHNTGLSPQQVKSVVALPEAALVSVDMDARTVEIRQNPEYNPTGSEAESPVDSSYVLDVNKNTHPIKDDELTRQFLAGEYCLRGGTGWWQYEFCFGRHVSQFHQEQGKRTTITLGHWNKETHLRWAKTKTVVKTESSLLLMYSNGDFCELTGKLRQTQVKLKCRGDQQGQPMTIYLVEPSPCSYIVGVESPILCAVINKADENGIISE